MNGGSLHPVSGQGFPSNSPDSRRDGFPCPCVCTEEDLRNGGRFFDFDLQLVERALQDDKSAFEMLCEKLCAKLDQIEAKIAQLCPGWSSEHLERVRDLFVHDRFLRLFTNPPKDKIEDFNALCWKFLYDSIVDAWRFYRRPKRNFQVEVSADITDPTAQRDFWETHGTEIVSNPTRLPCDQAEVSDLMAYMGHCLDLMSPKKRNVIKLWMLGYSEKEIAASLDMTKGNVGSIVSRTIADLREKLRKKMG